MDYLKSFKKYLNEAVDKIDDKEAAMDFDDLKDKDIDNDGDVDKSDSYLHKRLGTIAKKTNEDEELEEASVTANLDGGEGPPRTPYAFHDQEDEKKGSGKKKQKDNATTATDYELVKDSIYKKMILQMEDLHEVSYREFKQDPTSTPQQKVNRGIMEVNKMLAEIEKIVNNNLRLKTETGVQSGHFWKTTGKRFAKINERMLRVAHRLKELSQ